MRGKRAYVTFKLQRIMWLKLHKREATALMAQAHSRKTWWSSSEARSAVLTRRQTALQD